VGFLPNAVGGKSHAWDFFLSLSTDFSLKLTTLGWSLAFNTAQSGDCTEQIP
jgi:hypothetical protein